MSRSPSGSPLDSPAASPSLLNSQISQCAYELVLYESYLHKTPPLSSLIMKWTKRWFVLSRTDPNEPTSLELSYYKDESRKEKRGCINLAKFVGIRPNARVGSKENVFAIETEERKYILKAADVTTKNIWLAKLCEMCGQEQVYHISVPQQPSATSNEAIVKFAITGKLVVVLPSTGAILLEIGFQDIRRLGCMNLFASDIIWLETCKNSAPENFYFFSVPTSVKTAQQMVQELKSVMETHLSVLLIMEDSNDTDISFISREHYGCQEFSPLARSKILQSGLRQLPPHWKRCNEQHIRHESEPIVSNGDAAAGISLEDWGTGKSKRKLSISSSSPHPPLTRKPTLDKFRQGSFSSDRCSPTFDGQLSDSGCASDVFEPPQNSPNRKLSHQSSISSQSSATSLPYSPTIPENGILEDPFDDSRTLPSPTSRPPGPVVPPRSMVSLQQGPYYRQKIPAAI